MGVAKGQEESAATLGTAAITKEARNIPQGEGRCLLAASQGFQEAYALARGDHSIFTHYLLKGLKGNEESFDIHGYVTPFTLGNYVFKSIADLPPEKRPKQQPLVKAEVGGDIVLADYAKDDRTPPRLRPKKGHKRIIAVGVIIGLLIAALGVASQLLRDNDSPPPFRDNDSPPPFSSYEDDGIFVRYPNSWVADNSDLNPNDDIIPISFRPPEGNGIVWIYIEDGHSESVSRYLDRRIEDIEDIDHEDIEEDTDIEFAGNNGYRIVSTYDYRGTATKQTEIGTIHDDKLYSIYYIAPSESYNSYLGAVDEIINSFRIVQ